MISAYNKEQLEALTLIRQHLATLTVTERHRLLDTATNYLGFRDAVDLFWETYFSTTCTQTCFQNQLSACCTREGIITFFADVAINALLSKEECLLTLQAALTTAGPTSHKCVYLGPKGCLWTLKPIVCQMFLCDQAKATVFQDHPEVATRWEALKKREKAFKWPDRPVLFDDLELYFMAAGYVSPLMYINTSPGLLRVKKEAQKARPPVA